MAVTAAVATIAVGGYSVHEQKVATHEAKKAQQRQEAQLAQQAKDYERAQQRARNAANPKKPETFLAQEQAQAKGAQSSTTLTGPKGASVDPALLSAAKLLGT